MAWFGRKKDRVIDLGKRYNKMQEKKLEVPSPISNDNVASGLGFLSDIASSVSNSSENENDSNYVNLSDTEDRKSKIARRLLDMTDKIEDLSNQIYHLKQRMEVLEKKMKVSFE